MFSRRLGQAAKRTFTSSVSMQMGCVSEIKKVGVVGMIIINPPCRCDIILIILLCCIKLGLGLMGHGIAQISAVNGYQVVAVESSAEALDKGMARISGSLDKMLKKEASKGIITEVGCHDSCAYLCCPYFAVCGPARTGPGQGQEGGDLEPH